MIEMLKKDLALLLKTNGRYFTDSLYFSHLEKTKKKEKKKGMRERKRNKGVGKGKAILRMVSLTNGKWQNRTTCL